MVLNKYGFLTNGVLFRFCCGAKLFFLKPVVNRFYQQFFSWVNAFLDSMENSGVDMNFSDELLDGSYILGSSEKD